MIGMKRIIIVLFLSINILVGYANDVDNLSLGVFVDNNQSSMPSEALSFLTNKMKRLVVANGYADNETTGRFALVAQCDILEKDIAPTTPPRISQKLEMSFLVVDLIENKIYGGCDLTLSGIGINETKAFNNAFQKLSVQNQQLKSLLIESKIKILDYYSNSCPGIMTEAETFASMGQYDKAIFNLMSVPAICTDCYNNCQNLATEMYQRKIDEECIRLLEQAKSKWSSSLSETSAEEVGIILGRIDPRAKDYPDVVKFRNNVSSKLAADARRRWEFQMKKYEDNQQFKRSIVDACRSVGEIFAKNFQLPQIKFFKRH